MQEKLFLTYKVLRDNNMEQQSPQTAKPARFLTAQNGFVLHITPRVKPKEVKMAKSAGPHLIYGISYVHPVPMPMTLSN